MDIHTYEGELLKASYEIEVIPWTFYIHTNDKGIRMAYRFNGLESKQRITQYLTNLTLWENMEVQFPAPEIVGIFGLYKYYATCDTINFYNKNIRRQVED